MQELTYFEGRGLPPAKSMIIDGAWVGIGVVLFIAMTFLPDLVFGASIALFKWLIPTLVLAFGLLRFAFHHILYSNSKYLITNNKIQRESGIISKNIELIELFKITDMSYSSILGRGVITIHSTDVTSPTVELCVPDSRAIFEKIQKALPDARERSKVGMRMEID